MIDAQHSPALEMHPRPSRPIARACGLAVVVWGVATLLLVAIGDTVIPRADEPAAALAYLVATAASAIVGYGGALWHIARTRHDTDPRAAGSTVGIAIASIGLLADTVLVGSLGLGYPGVADDRADTIVVGLLCGHAAALLGAVLAGSVCARR